MEQLFTPEGAALAGDESALPWPDYPRPGLRRDSFFNLNGRWQFGVLPPGAKGPPAYDRAIRVPFCPESALSGVGQVFPPGSRLCYRRAFRLPEGFVRDRVLLHIGAADQTLTCRVNGRPAGSHAGGYEAMTFDITGLLRPENELELEVRDALDGVLPQGKQSRAPGGMWYTPVSGVWQTVWLESVPERYIRRLAVRADGEQAVVDTGDESLSGTVTVNGPDGPFSAPLVKGRAVLRPARARLWSPETPVLYPFVVEAGPDRVESYFALRTLEIKRINGRARLCLNGRPYFFHGVLDQGYFPDGLFTPAGPAGYEKDILAMKALGFNTLRKHIKVEPDLFYYLCDKLGMAVFQDMVPGGGYDYRRDTLVPNLRFQTRRDDSRMHPAPAGRAAFLAGMEATVAALENHPCVVLWTIFNEGWGQFCSTDCYRRLKRRDPTRFVNTVSGWFRGGQTDVDSRHIYFGPWTFSPGEKPMLITEFGGVCLPVAGHRYDPEKTYGYGARRTGEELERALAALYEKKVLPLAKKGLCGAVYTQLSDVEQEVNGLLTWDRRVAKVRPGPMQAIARRLRDAAGVEQDR